jgi:hypothetical protein
MSNDMQYHHFFPKAWLMRQGVTYEWANTLGNIVMLTVISNQAVGDQPPTAYLQDEIDFSDEPVIRDRLESLLVSPQAFDAAIRDDYQEFLQARSETLLNWASELVREAPSVKRVAGEPDPEVARRALSVEVLDTDTDD